MWYLLTTASFVKWLNMKLTYVSCFTSLSVLWTHPTLPHCLTWPSKSIKPKNLICAVVMSFNFRHMGDIFHLSLVHLWYKFKCSANCWMRSAIITAVTSWFMSDGSFVSTLTPVKICSMFGVLPFLLHLSIISALDCSLISLAFLSVLKGSLSLLYVSAKQRSADWLTGALKIQTQGVQKAESNWC